VIGVRHRWRWGVALVAGACLVGCAGGRPAPSAADHDRPRTGSGHAQVDAIALILPPVIDGRLDEGIWQHTPPYSDFAALGGRRGPARRRTEFRIAYDAGNLYIALACPTDTSIGAPKVRHWQDDQEGIDEDESCCVRLWPDPDRPDVCLEVKVNPRGVVSDALRYEGWPMRSTGWDGPTQAAARILPGRWQAELRIPLVRLGIPDRPWHVNVIRHDALAEERASLAPRPADPKTTSVSARPIDSPRALLRWPVPARPFLTGPLPIRQLRLTGTREAVKRWRATSAVVAVSDKHATEGRHALEVSFQVAGGSIRFAPAEASFSGWETLRFDVFVGGDEPIVLGVRLRDVLGRTRTGWLVARPKANDVILPLDLLGAGLRLRGIKALELLSRSPVKVWVDHIRLQEDTISCHELPHRPARPTRSSLSVEIDQAVVGGPSAETPVAVDVTVPLFLTQKVRRLERRQTGSGGRMTFGPEAFAGHDARDPVRVMGFVQKDGQGYFAFRELRLSRTAESITFGVRDFPPAVSASPAASAVGSSR